jgi:hypothetical protein
MRPVRREAWTLVAAMVATFGLLRISLLIEPDADFYLLGLNIHHLFTGLAILTAAGLPLVLLGHDAPFRPALLGAFGVGLAMSLDEWVYLIATDGSNAAYLTPVSLWGGAIAIGIACLLTLVIAYRRDR